MRFEGVRQVPAYVEAVWTTLSDREVPRRVVSGLRVQVDGRGAATEEIP